MSHQFESGIVSRKQAWHGLADLYEEGISFAQAKERPEVLWRVEKKEITDPQLNDYRKLVRSDTNQILGVCAPSWTPVQNMELLEWFEPLIADQWIEIDTMIVLQEGRIFCITAKILDNGSVNTAEVIPGDPIEQYLIAFNGHVPGKLSAGGKFTNIRVVCMNTLHAALEGMNFSESTTLPEITKHSEKTFTCRHSKGVLKNLEAARNAIDYQKRIFQGSVEQWQAMAKKDLSAELYEQYISRVFRKELITQGSNGLKKMRPVTSLQCWETLVTNFENGEGPSDPAKRNLWGAYQSVTKFFSHQKGRSSESRFNSNLFGYNKGMIKTAHQEAMAMTR